MSEVCPWLEGRKTHWRKSLLVKIANSTYWCICCAEKFLRDSCFPELSGNPPTSAAVGKGTSVPSSWEQYICDAGFLNYSTGKAVLKGTLRARKKKSHSAQQKLKVVLISCWKQSYSHTSFSPNIFPNFLTGNSSNYLFLNFSLLSLCNSSSSFSETTNVSPKLQLSLSVLLKVPFPREGQSLPASTQPFWWPVASAGPCGQSLSSCQPVGLCWCWWCCDTPGHMQL